MFPEANNSAAVHQLAAAIAQQMADATLPLPATLTRQQAAAYLNVSLSQFGAMETGGSLGPVPLELGGPRCIRYLKSELTAWLDAGAPSRPTWQQIRRTALRRSA